MAEWGEGGDSCPEICKQSRIKEIAGNQPRSCKPDKIVCYAALSNKWDSYVRCADINFSTSARIPRKKEGDLLADLKIQSGNNLFHPLHFPNDFQPQANRQIPIEEGTELEWARKSLLKNAIEGGAISPYTFTSLYSHEVRRKVLIESNWNWALA